ncbi:MAG: cadherin-like domain-containing protein, partial [Clostridia bacterium]|nr:cadherin-like domain-containing protein [Clostridia bacterium]
SRFAESESPLQRLLYDNTYHYIKKDLQTSPDALPPLTVRTQKERPVSGRMKADADATLRFRLYESPKHGTVSLSENGSFTYYPDAGYTGTDRFSVVVSRHMAESAPTAVTVNVS